MRLKIAQVDRPREHINLCAAIVDVIFARHLVADEIQKARQRIAENRAARMAHMKRPCRVGRHVFNIDPLALPQGRTPEIGPSLENRAHQILPERRCKPQIEEPRPRHLGAGHTRIIGKLTRQSLGNIARLHLRGLGKHHRRIGRHIPMRRIARRLDRDIGEIKPLGQHALGLHCFKRRDDKRADFGKKVHRSGPRDLRRVYHSLRSGQPITPCQRAARAPEAQSDPSSPKGNPTRSAPPRFRRLPPRSPPANAQADNRYCPSSKGTDHAPPA